MKRLVVLFFLLIPALSLLAQRISNIKFVQSYSGKVCISYTIYDKPANIFVEYSADGGKTYRRITMLEGDHGRNVKPGAHAVDWDATAEVGSFNAAKAKFRIVHAAGLVGRLDGAFSVSDSRQVNFSRGNLQYQASSGRWRFADKQYAVIGDGNGGISATYSGWIDLFGWGTSGWSSGAKCFMPFSTSAVNNDYFVGGAQNNNMTGNYANADWGQFNKVSNGGEVAKTWRVLTAREWDYMLKQRADAKNKWASATVNKVHGIILLPDVFTKPSGITFKAGNKTGYKTNIYNEMQWQVLESAGAVFLPAGGNRTSATVAHTGVFGYYWSSTADFGGAAYMMCFGSTTMVPANTGKRHIALMVRLVQ